MTPSSLAAGPRAVLAAALRSTRVLGAVLAVALHAGLLAWLFSAPRPKPPANAQRVVTRIRAVARPAAPAPVVAAPARSASAEPTPRAPAPAPRKPAPKPAQPRKEQLAAAPPPVPEPAPLPQPSEAPKPRRFTVAMDATVPGGGVAVPSSNAASSWAFGGAEGSDDGAQELPKGGGVAGAASAAPPGTLADAAELTAYPEILGQPSPDELRALYPEAARAEGLEANVALRILVSERGEVVRARVVRPVGNGFDDAATRLARRLRFRPGERRGEAVAVWIPWTFKFRLDG